VARVRGFDFELSPESSKSSHWNCDGELVDLSSLSVRVLPRAVNVFAQASLDEDNLGKSETMTTLIKEEDCEYDY